MSFARFLETGSGSIGVRLMIEGLDTGFVSDPSMERTLADGRILVCALPQMGAGIIIEDSVNIPEATLEAQGTSIRLQEQEDESIARAIAWRPDVERFISATIGLADTTINLLSTTGITTGDVVHVGTEAMLVTGTTSTTLTVTRGHWQTIPQAHWSNTPTIPYRALTNRPLALRGRRAYVYLYGEGDDPQGDGTQVGVYDVTSNPRLGEAGTVWSLQLSSIAERLSAKVGGELAAPRGARGIYYPWSAPLRVTLEERSGGSPVTRSGAFTGFFETQGAFCTALTAWIGTLPSGLASTFRAVEKGDQWTIEAVVASGVTEVAVALNSEQDGRTNDRSDSMVDEDGARVGPGALTTGQLVYPAWITAPFGARRVPRGFYGPSREVERDPTATLTAPSTRIYLDGAVSSDWTAVLLEFAGGSATVIVTDRDITDAWIEVRSDVPREASTPEAAFAYSRDQPVKVRPTRTLVSRGALSDLRNALVLEGPLYANRGTAPFVTDADLADWTAVVAQAARRPWQRTRTWALATAVDLDELLSHEMRLLGVFPIIDDDGKINIQILDLPNASTNTVTTIDDEITDVGWSSMERGGQTINRVIMKTGYDPIEDDWIGATFDTSDFTSLAQDHQDRSLEIEPRSLGIAMSAEDAAEAVIPVLSMFGYAHDFITVNVSWQLFHLRLGSFVEFSAHHLPDYSTGQRPISRVVGTVVGRRWALGEYSGQLRILVSWQNVSGYAPTARVLGHDNITGDTWDLALDPGMYAPAGRRAAEFFSTGDVVELVEYDTEAPFVLAGTVVSTLGDTTRVTFGGTWTPGSATWELCYRPHSLVTEDQKRFAFIAEASGLVGAAAPRTFAP